MDIAPFGKVDKERLEEYYEGRIEVGGNSFEIDLNFESFSVDEFILETVSKFIDNIEKMVSKAFGAIAEDYDLGDESETAVLYLKHHIDESSTEELKSIFGTTDIDKELFLNKLSLKRVGLYPEDEESFSIFDIQLPEEFTNYLMAVTFDANGKLAYIAMES